MFRLLICLIIILTGCGNSGEKQNNPDKAKDISKIEKKLLLKKKIKNIGILNLYNLKSGKQIITLKVNGKERLLNKEFEKDTIIHSLSYAPDIKMYRFNTLSGSLRSQYFWNTEDDILYYNSVDDNEKKVEKSDNLTNKPELLKFISGLIECSPVKKESRIPVIKYSLKNEESVMQSNTVIADIDGKKIEIPDKEERCIMMVEQKDFDGDGDIDLLLEDAVACGGNCCPNGFYTVSYQDGKFNISKIFNSSWSGIKVEKWKGRWSFLSTFINFAGANTDPYYEATKRHILLNGKIKLVEFIEKEEMKALINIRSSDFNMEKADKEKTYSFDVDGDGKKETLSCRLWSRWGTVLCTIKKDCKVIAKSIGGKRFGFLSSKTGGMHDIVINHDNIYKWNGKKYVETKK
ncbi:MAG: hypothetical protein SVT56_11480 [Chloroflexota bacterium]|nr:hypothetical protein [Chloroflexota bacterium]